MRERTDTDKKISKKKSRKGKLSEIIIFKQHKICKILQHN